MIVRDSISAKTNKNPLTTEVNAPVVEPEKTSLRSNHPVIPLLIAFDEEELFQAHVE